MSFSSEQKLEIISQPIKSSCCRHAMVQGIIVSRGVCEDGKISLSLDKEVAAYAEKLIGEIYSKQPVYRASSIGGRRHILSFESSSAVKYLASFYDTDHFLVEKCPMCRPTFMRGIFLASGRVSDPFKQYSLEFSVGRATDKICAFFEDCGFVPRISNKKKEVVIYFKNSGAIEDYFAISGMNQTTFVFMNAKIKGEIRNNANRIANCETNNIDKAVSASMSQISLIQQLIDKGLLSQLPEELEKTALLRVEHKDMSLSRLASIMTPPISKPGLSHRLKKISSMAESLLHKSK